MNKWKLAFLILVPLLILSNLFFAYALFDTAVSYSYLTDSFERQSEANEQLGNLIILGSEEYSQKDFLHLLRQANPEAFIVEEGQKISIGQNAFLFENDKLMGVQ